eukprot:TRINITY_DN69789_c0_g1_i1.p1 TRINITY_DN69789_c0_g1~~TRINITY_DN69789_c0_g1_i1.p1  ORF type:complete len:631 (-),score=107.85 TRINITY_DN69789_c0_g1_i1:265-2157(-)
MADDNRIIDVVLIFLVVFVGCAALAKFMPDKVSSSPGESSVGPESGSYPPERYVNPPLRIGESGESQYVPDANEAPNESSAPLPADIPVAVPLPFGSQATRQTIGTPGKRVEILPAEAGDLSTRAPFAPVVLNVVNRGAPLSSSIARIPVSLVDDVFFKELRNVPVSGAHIPQPGMWTHHGLIVPVPQHPDVVTQHRALLNAFGVSIHGPNPFLKGGRPKNFIPFVYDAQDGSDKESWSGYKIPSLEDRALPAGAVYLPVRPTPPVRARVVLGVDLPPTDMNKYTATPADGGIGYGPGSNMTPPFVGPTVYWPPVSHAQDSGGTVVRMAVLQSGLMKKTNFPSLLRSAADHWYPDGVRKRLEVKVFMASSGTNSPPVITALTQLAKTTPSVRRSLGAVEYIANGRAYWRAMTLRRDVLFALMRAYSIPYMGVYLPRGHKDPRKANWFPMEGKSNSAGAFVRAWNIFSLFYTMHRASQLKREWSARYGQSFDVVWRHRPDYAMGTRLAPIPQLLPASAGGSIPDAKYWTRDASGRTPADKVVATYIGGPQFLADSPKDLKGFYRSQSDNSFMGGDTVMDTILDSLHEDVSRIANFAEAPGSCPGNRHCVFAESLLARAIQLCDARNVPMKF